MKVKSICILMMLLLLLSGCRAQNGEKNLVYVEDFTAGNIGSENDQSAPEDVGVSHYFECQIIIDIEKGREKDYTEEYFEDLYAAAVSEMNINKMSDKVYISAVTDRAQNILDVMDINKNLPDFMDANLSYRVQTVAAGSAPSKIENADMEYPKTFEYDGKLVQYGHIVGRMPQKENKLFLPEDFEMIPLRALWVYTDHPSFQEFQKEGYLIVIIEPQAREKRKIIKAIKTFETEYGEFTGAPRNVYSYYS